MLLDSNIPESVLKDLEKQMAVIREERYAAARAIRLEREEKLLRCHSQQQSLLRLAGGDVYLASPIWIELCAARRI